MKMKQTMKWLALLGCMYVMCGFTACRERSATRARVPEDTLASDRTDRVRPKYAKGFKTTYLKDGVCLVDIEDPEGRGAETFHYALVPRGRQASGLAADYVVLEIPVKGVVCMTSLQLSNFIKLEELEHVVGITSTRHLFDQEMNDRLKAGKTAKIGIEGNFDNEVIMGLNPDLILISPFKRGGYDALKEVGIPLVPHLGYKEVTPLGQAEWIKFIGLLLGEEEKANRQFAEIEERYEALKTLTDTVKTRPVVFSGEMRGGNWYAVGGNSFLAHLFRDAGADYFLKDNTETGGVILDYETVYSKAAHADYWRIVNSFHGDFSYEVLQAEDSRYADFQAFKDRGVIYCNMSQRPFYERMPVSPEVVLADLIKVFHPALLPGHQPMFYERLK